MENLPGFDDLLFEFRNKEYGAYQLRKRYGSVVVRCIFYASLIFSSLIIVPFLLNQSSDKILSSGVRHVEVQMDLLESPEEQSLISPVPLFPYPDEGGLQKSVRYITPEIADSVIQAENTVMAADEITMYDEDILYESTNRSENDFLFEEGETGDSEPFFLAEVMPSFDGGDINRFREWLKNRTFYPKEAIDNKISGTVFLTFVVEKDGSVGNVAVVKGIHPLLDTLSIKAISGSPRWSPGLQRGRPVRIVYSISLTFAPY